MDNPNRSSQLQIVNNSSQSKTIKLFNTKEIDQQTDYLNGFIDSNNNLYTRYYENITGWDKTLYPTLYFKKVGTIIFAYPTVLDWTNNTNALFYFTETGTAQTVIGFVTDQSVLSTIYVYLTGFSSTNALIDWGDGNSDVLPISLISANITHSYSVTGNYTVTVTVDYNQLKEILLLNDQIINGFSFSNVSLLQSFQPLGNLLTQFPEITQLQGVKQLDLRDNALTDINNILITLDGFGLTGGVALLDGGTNAAPSGAGITAKNNLTAKSWTITNN